MAEKVTVSMQMSILVKEAVLLAGVKENRSLSNFMLTAILERLKEKHGIIPEPEDTEI